jgi:hypothetical protein
MLLTSNGTKLVMLMEVEHDNKRHIKIKDKLK